MNPSCRLVRSLVLLSLLAAPQWPAQAQSAPNYAACVMASELPEEYGIAIQFPDESDWRPSLPGGRSALLASSSKRSANVRIWKRLPRSDSEATIENTLIYTIHLMASDKATACEDLKSKYELRRQPDGWVLL